MTATILAVLAPLVWLAYGWYSRVRNLKQIETAKQQAITRIKRSGFQISRQFFDIHDLGMLFDDESRRIAVIYGNLGEPDEPMNIEFFRAEELLQVRRGSQSVEGRALDVISVTLRAPDSLPHILSFAHRKSAVECWNQLIRWAPKTAIDSPQRIGSRESRYDLILVHSVVNPDRLLTILIERMAISDQQAHQMISNAPTFLLRGVAYADACKLKMQLEHAGASIDMQPSI